MSPRPAFQVVILSVCVSLLASCGNNDKKTDNADVAATEEPATGKEVATADKAAPEQVGTFDIESIPVSDKDLGSFPFFSLPKGVKSQNKEIQREYDRLFFPLNGVMTPLEGKVWKTNLVTASENERNWSLPFVEKSYDEAIKAAGGVKIFEGKVSSAELDRIKEQATYFGEDGSLDYWNSPVKVYAIRRPDKSVVYIQLGGNTSSGEIQILQTEAFEQTIKMLKSDEIKADLEGKGKAVLNINFDHDKATLKADGKEAVAEITKVLEANKSLNLAINGYTDNTGSAEHNLQLSQERAATVLATIVASGIDKSRLASNGFGDKNPLAANDSEENKARNRRVELVKK